MVCQSSRYEIRRIAWNNSFHKIPVFNACWWESVKHLQFYCSCLPASLLVYQRRVIFWLKMLNSNNLALHALGNCCKDSIIGTLEKYRANHQLNLVSVSEYLNIFGNILAAIICRCLIDYIVLFLCIAYFFSVLYAEIHCYVEIHCLPLMWPQILVLYWFQTKKLVVYCMCAFYVLVLFYCFGVIYK